MDRLTILKRITRTAMIAGVYFGLGALLQPLSFGVIQLRFCEALVMLSAFMIEGVFGVTLGCFLLNFFFSPFGIYDAVFGTLITLLAGFMTYKIKNIYLSCLPPIILNALGLPLIWYLMGVDTLYWVNMLSILASQTIVVGIIGVPLAIGLKKALPEKYYK